MGFGAMALGTYGSVTYITRCFQIFPAPTNNNMKFHLLLLFAIASVCYASAPDPDGNKPHISKWLMKMQQSGSLDSIKSTKGKGHDEHASGHSVSVNLTALASTAAGAAGAEGAKPKHEHSNALFIVMPIVFLSLLAGFGFKALLSKIPPAFRPPFTIVLFLFGFMLSL
jgi:hypothetical protein